ncbi:glycosyltransferase family 2 protein [Azospirillum cavernae]|nr:glycosyltransferase family A protein [Azospirillum cavernae]
MLNSAAMPTFSVIIPTRNRARTLREAIPTVLAQTDGDLEVIVQDNASPDDTRAVVLSFDDPRIVYRRSDHPLSMHDNWAAALEAARGEWIIVIGDDDALLPDACAQAKKIIAATGARLLTWVAAVYGWPCHDAPEFRNMVQVLLGDGWEEISCRQVLEELYTRRRGWIGAPSIYHGFVHRSVIDTARGRAGGRYFFDLQPDIGATLTNLFCAKEYVKSLEPLSIAGWSRGSNGGRGQTPEAMRAMLKRLAAEAGQTIESWTVLSDTRLAGMETMMLGTLANVRITLGISADSDAAPPVPADERSVLRCVMRDPGGISVPFDEWKQAILEHAERLEMEIDPATLVLPPAPRHHAGFSADGEGYLRQIRLDAGRLGCNSLGDAVQRIAAILRNYRVNPAAVRSSLWPVDPVLRRGQCL